MPEKIAILCSDLHLSHNPPIARSREPDWYEAMTRPLAELRDLTGDYLPVFCGGDVFEKWKSPPKLINFAMRELPQFFYSVMGQHDMPYHNWEERESSAFWTLVEGRRIQVVGNECDDLECEWQEKGMYGREGDGDNAWLMTRGFHWGESLEYVGDGIVGDVKLCVAHKYCWAPGHVDHSVANAANGASFHAKRLKGYDVALFGDNHKGFMSRIDGEGVIIFNAGTFMRRCSDEVDYRPMVGILYEDGTVEPHHLDTSKDVIRVHEDVKTAERMLLNIDSFVEELRGMEESGLRFETVIERTLEEHGAGRSVRRIILEAMEGK